MARGRNIRPRFWGRGSFPGRRSYRRGGALRFCEELGREVSYEQCLECPNFGEWEDGDMKRCKYEYESLKSQGYYARTEGDWLGYMEKLDPENWKRLAEEKRNRKRVQAEMDAGEAEMEKTAAELREELEDLDAWDGYAREKEEGNEMESGDEEGDDNGEREDDNFLDEDENDEEEEDEEEDDWL